MFKLIYEKDGNYTFFGNYKTDKDARLAIIEYCKSIDFESYYWNCYQIPENSEYAGGIHIDFGSWSEFFILSEEK